jgi:hypothetical protein
MGAAITDLLGGVRDEILKVRANAVIEYRVRYSNLATLSMANCHRGNDAPFDADYIRRENLFLRLFCEYPSAVWSDYAYWHEKEKTENISLMLGMQIFSGGVPTVSVDLPKCGTRQLKTMKSWLEFYNEHSDSLAKAGLTVNSADSMMSVTSLENRKSRMAYTLLSGQHVPAKIELKSGIREVWVLNASAEDSGEMEFTAGKLSALAKISGNLPIRVKLK